MTREKVHINIKILSPLEKSSFVESCTTEVQMQKKITLSSHTLQRSNYVPTLKYSEGTEFEFGFCW